MERKVQITVDGKEISVNEEANLLETCLNNDIYIPNLCYMEGMESPPASCRLCFVEIEGQNNPVSSCTVKVSDGMVVFTDTDKVRTLQRTALKLLLSTHQVDCANCHANKNCGIQNLAKFLKVGLKSKEFKQYLKPIDIDETHPGLYYYPNRCVLCGRCIYACGREGQAGMSFARRGIETVITFYGQKDASNCESCGKCIEVCPVKALILKEPVD